MNVWGPLIVYWLVLRSFCQNQQEYPNIIIVLYQLNFRIQPPRYCEVHLQNYSRYVREGIIDLQF